MCHARLEGTTQRARAVPLLRVSPARLAPSPSPSSLSALRRPASDGRAMRERDRAPCAAPSLESPSRLRPRFGRARTGFENREGLGARSFVALPSPSLVGAVSGALPLDGFAAARPSAVLDVN